MDAPWKLRIRSVLDRFLPRTEIAQRGELHALRTGFSKGSCLPDLPWDAASGRLSAQLATAIEPPQSLELTGTARLMRVRGTARVNGDSAAAAQLARRGTRRGNAGRE